MICALYTSVFNGGSNCGKQVRITNTNTGQSAIVTVAGEDFSGLFTLFFATQWVLCRRVPNLRWTKCKSIYIPVFVPKEPDNLTYGQYIDLSKGAFAAIGATEEQGEVPGAFSHPQYVLLALLTSGFENSQVRHPLSPAAPRIIPPKRQYTLIFFSSSQGMLLLIYLIFFSLTRADGIQGGSLAHMYVHPRVVARRRFIKN